MQPIPVQGPRNPNGHTEDEVRRALHGVDGSQRMTFRYDLLDRTNRLLRPLDEVAADSGRVTLNNLGDIKRDLSLRVRSGTGVDWGSNRIQPWARLHLPPYGPQDWVEWPLGVFLPTTPTQSVDATRYVWRDIQAYDQGVILADDQIPGRYTTGAHLDILDTYQRTASGFWGTPDVGPVWQQSTANTVYTVSNGIGSVTLTGSPSIVRVSIPDRRYRDGEVYTRLSVNQIATGATYLPSLLLRYIGVGVYYRARIHLGVDGSVSMSAASGTSQVGATEPTGLTYTAGGWLHARARLVGQDLMARVWLDGTPEPTGWMLERTITSAQVADGQFGVSVSTAAANTNVSPQFRFSRFELNANPTDLVTGEVRRVLEQAGVVQHQITPSVEVMPTPRDWDPGTSRAMIIADLLSSINYRSLSFDEEGTAVAAPYVPPGQRATEFVYVDDSRSIMVPDAVEEYDLYAVPNRWTGTVSEPDRDELNITFTNRDPASPTSTVRRGRVITEVRDQQDATSESALIEQIAQVAFESSQLYEAQEFATALNPLHSHDDVYSIRRDDLAVDADFTGHTWEMDLASTGLMRHRARRVVSLTPATDPSIVVGDATITGALSAGNIRTGTINVSPVPNTPTPVTVTGLNLTGTGPVRVQLTAVTAVPGGTLREVTLRNPSPDGFVLWVYRTNATATNIHYLAIRGA